MKTLAIRLEDDEHAQLAALAQLRGTTLIDELREAVAQHLRSKIGEAELITQAQSALEEIERDAQSRRHAIEALLGQQTSAEATPRRTRQQTTPSS